jgi:formylglycine-generating enzyme required for sulfatase activity
VALPAWAVVIQWATVGDPGNAGDPATFRGAVPYTYQIGKYDVTNGQYVEFLNAKDPGGANSLGLYDPGMTSVPNVAGITFDGAAPAGSKYHVIAGQANKPVAYVTFYSALRFANWLNNGQGNADTENGSYTLLGGTPQPTNGTSVTRNAGAGIIVPTENEWYKAAYYKGGGTNAGYWLYATQSNTQPASSPPSLTAVNSANYLSDGGAYAVSGSTSYDPNQNYLTDVGAYGNSASAYRTYDQNGDLYQWLETLSIIGPASSARRDRGGSWSDVGADMRSTWFNDDIASGGEAFLGFRVASVPEPTGAFALFVGMVLMQRRKR